MQVDMTVRVDDVRIGDLISGTFGADATVVGVVNNKTMPRRVDLSLGDPTDPSMPPRTVTVNRYTMVSVTRSI